MRSAASLIDHLQGRATLDHVARALALDDNAALRGIAGAATAVDQEA